jgi:hypothetical protein
MGIKVYQSIKRAIGLAGKSLCDLPVVGDRYPDCKFRAFSGTLNQAIPNDLRKRSVVAILEYAADEQELGVQVCAKAEL